MPPAATGILRRWSADGNETNRERSTKLQNISLDKNRPESPLGPSFPIGGNALRTGAGTPKQSPINEPASGIPIGGLAPARPVVGRARWKSDKRKGRASKRGLFRQFVRSGNDRRLGGHVLDPLRQARQLARGHVAVQDTLLGAARDQRLRLLEGFLRDRLIAGGDGFFDLADRGADRAQARAVDLRTTRGLANAFLCRGMMCHLDTLYLLVSNSEGAVIEGRQGPVKPG